MQQSTIRHELACLPIGLDIPDACKQDDALKLRKIAEAQAIEIVKLRRALLASNSTSAERLQIIYSLQGEDVEQQVNLKDTLEKISDLESDIYSIIKKSRWRKIGVKLGVERSREWENKAWRSNLALNSENLNHLYDAAQYEPPLSFALNEQNRLIQLWLQVSQSRWRRLGLRIKLAQELPLDISQHGNFKHHAQFHLSKPQHEETKPMPVDTRKANPTTFIQYTHSRFLEECQAFAVDAILDIGANTGQFGRIIRESGYHGQIFSFEPLSAAHSELVFNAREDMLWHAVGRCLIGSSNMPAKINIEGEECSVITLDTFIEHTFADCSMTFGLKIDAQGYEHQVIEGLSSCHERIKVIACKMSLRPLYADRISMSDLCHELSRLRFRCVALGPEYEHPVTGELLQVDGVFTRG